MSKKESTFLNMTITLFAITIVAGVSLGFINDNTKGPKAQAKLERKINALKDVLPAFNNNPVEDVKLVKHELAKEQVEIALGIKEQTQTGTNNRSTRKTNNTYIKQKMKLKEHNQGIIKKIKKLQKQRPKTH